MRRATRRLLKTLATPMKSLAVSLTILSDGRRRYSRSGLKVRRLRPGVYRVSTQDGSSLPTGLVMATISGRMSDDMVCTYVGPSREDGRDGEDELELVPVVSRVVLRRWYCATCTEGGSLLVKVYRIPDMTGRPRTPKAMLEAGADQRRRTVTADADFRVSVFVPTRGRRRFHVRS